MSPALAIRCACQRDPRGQCPECRAKERAWRRVLLGRPLPRPTLVKVKEYDP
jgi:hypothetical protein